MKHMLNKPLKAREAKITAYMTDIFCPCSGACTGCTGHCSGCSGCTDACTSRCGGCTAAETQANIRTGTAACGGCTSSQSATTTPNIVQIIAVAL